MTRNTDTAPVRDSPSRAPKPMSATQRRSWFLWKLNPGNLAYNEVRVHRLKGRISVPALQNALHMLVQRHPILRTSYSMVDGEPMQIVDDRVGVGLEIDDLSILPAEQRDSALHERLVSIAEHRFDLETGPLARFLLVRLGDDEHVLVRVWHHIVGDGTSASIFERELSVTHNALVAGRPPSLPALGLEYADYAALQAERMTTPALQRQLDYWMTKLADLPSLRLPADRVRPPIQSHRGARVEAKVAQPLVEALAALGRSVGATSFMTLLSAFYVLLHRYTDDEDIAVGTPIAGRTRAELEGLMGFFANTLVLRVDLTAEPTFMALLGRVRETAIDAYTHQELPFERLVEILAPRRDPSRNPLFQVAFAMQPGASTELSLEGVEARRVLPPTTHPKFDLTLTLRPSEEGMVAIWEYCSDVFAAATIEQMAAHFERLVESIVAEPEQRIGRIPMQSAAERALVAGWNKNLSPYPEHATVVELFEAQAAATPEAVAVVDEHRRLTYRELDNRANKLASLLRAAGAEPGQRIGICLERSPGLIVAMLATLKIGAAYVPLDPELPRERLAFLVGDARSTIVLTRSRHLAQLDSAPCRSLCLDRERETIAAHSGTAFASAAGVSDAAYVMYTSGSTGAPKGVAVPHRAIVRLVRDTDYVQIHAGDVLAQLANPAFDAATFEVWGALLNGARVAIIPRDTLLSPAALAGALDTHVVTTFFVTTALFNNLAREAPRAFAGREVLFGGEAVDPGAVAAALRDGKPKRLLHVYGPTETTTFATWFEVDAVASDALTVPIGGPIANTEVYVLDRYREPAPIGVAGEIYIGGPGVALGYLDRPELTAERFVAHPFDRAPEARLYRTGDRARYRADGAIEFLGRQDRQIKVRGHRVEPGEVEAQLLRLQQVREAVVVVREEGAGARAMIAYVVGQRDASPTPADLMRELRLVLPQYALPTAIVVLDALPLTRHGKVDRSALPEPDIRAEQRTGQHVPPRSPLQHMLVEIWEQLLGVQNVGINDSFFDLGGHSLLAAQMMDAVERACGCSVPLTMLFRGATILELSRALSGAAQVARDPVTALNEAGTRPAFFFLHGDFTGGGFYSRELARSLGPDQPFYAVHPHGLVDTGVPESIEAMAAERLHAVRRVRQRGPYVLGGHCNGAYVALEMARQLLKEGDHVPVLILMDARAPWRATRVFEGIRMGQPSIRPEHPQPEAIVPAGSMPERNASRYRRAMAAYVPQQYPGRIVVLRSEANKDLRPTLGWSAIAPSVETFTIPGDHHSSITRHVAATGALIKTVLEAAFVDAGLALNRPMQ